MYQKTQHHDAGHQGNKVCEDLHMDISGRKMYIRALNMVMLDIIGMINSMSEPSTW